MERRIKYRYLQHTWSFFLAGEDAGKICWIVQWGQIGIFFDDVDYAFVDYYRLGYFFSSMNDSVADG